jgi:hypothetical protein
METKKAMYQLIVDRKPGLSFEVLEIVKSINEVKPAWGGILSPETHVFIAKIPFNILSVIYELNTDNGIEFMKNNGWLDDQGNVKQFILDGEFKVRIVLEKDYNVNYQYRYYDDIDDAYYSNWMFKEDWVRTSVKGNHFFYETSMIIDDSTVVDDNVKTSFNKSEIYNYLKTTEWRTKRHNINDGHGILMSSVWLDYQDLKF